MQRIAGINVTKLLLSLLTLVEGLQVHVSTLSQNQR